MQPLARATVHAQLAYHGRCELMSRYGGPLKTRKAGDVSGNGPLGCLSSKNLQ